MKTTYKSYTLFSTLPSSYKVIRKNNPLHFSDNPFKNKTPSKNVNLQNLVWFFCS